MAIIEEFVNAAKKQAASDLHIIAGIPPRIRVNGELCSLDDPGISAEDVEGMLNQIIPSPCDVRKTGRNRIYMSNWNSALPCQCIFTAKDSRYSNTYDPR